MKKTLLMLAIISTFGSAEAGVQESNNMVLGIMLPIPSAVLKTTSLSKRPGL